MEIDIAKHQGAIVVRSSEIATHFGKRHDNVLRDIDRLIRESATHPSILRDDLFFETTFKNDRNRQYREFLLSKDGFALIAMGFTGAKALQWKFRYIDAFNKMESALKESSVSVMQSFNDAISVFEKDKSLASIHGKALAHWKVVRKHHIEAVTSAHEKAQLVLNFSI